MTINFRGLLLILLLFMESLYAEFDYKISNTNITLSGGAATQKEKNDVYNYDRLRVQTDYTGNGFFGTVIGDGVNYLGGTYVNSNDFEYLKKSRSDTPFKTQTNFKDYGNGSAYAKLYRAYGGYEDSKNRVVVGLQNISMGVGRIWTPVNIFNPRNIYAIEPDEIFGVNALSYVRYLDETSHVAFVVSQNSQRNFKCAGQYKSFLSFADVAIDIVSSDKTKMVAYEIEGNLADTGIELRSEVAYIKSNLSDLNYKESEKEFYQGVVGAEYGFKNGVTLVVESLYSSKKFSYNEVLSNLNSDIFSNFVYSNFYAGATLSYTFNTFLDASILYVDSFESKGSSFVSPSLRYTLNDFNSFTIGAQVQNGSSDDRFAAFGNRYYFKWNLSF